MKFDLYGIGGVFVDVSAPVTDEQLHALHVTKSRVRLQNSVEQQQLIAALGIDCSRGEGGGSVANAVYCCAQLGGSTVFSGKTANDDAGRLFREELRAAGVAYSTSPALSGSTGTCLVLMTSDGERTFCADPGVSTELNLADIDSGALANSRWFLAEGHLLAYSDASRSLIRRALQMAHQQGCKTALTFGDVSVIDNHRSAVDDILPLIDLLFGNAAECCAYTGRENPDLALRALAARVPGVVVTCGGDGALAWLHGQELRARPVPCTPCDSNGAGDAFAGSFLYGLSREVPPPKALYAAGAMAAAVVSQVGPRLRSSPRALWQRSVAAAPG